MLFIFKFKIGKGHLAGITESRETSFFLVQYDAAQGHSGIDKKDADNILKLSTKKLNWTLQSRRALSVGGRHVGHAHF